MTRYDVTPPGGPILPFTPSRESGEVLEARTVGRDQLLGVLASRVDVAARSKNRIHTLLVGPRGSGKSHLVEVALHQLRSDPQLRDRFAVVTLPEDVLGITRFTDIVDVVLKQVHGGSSALPRAGTDRHWSQVTDALGGRILLLVVENLDRLFSALGEAGQGDLRAWVETSGNVLVLATTPLITSAVTSRDRPWFGGFAVEELPGLTPDEGGELLSRIAAERGNDALVEFLASPTGRARVQSVAQLTGGSPRVWTILADCVSIESLDDLIPAVQDLLEGLVPYYQQLLWDLAPNEQRIVRSLAEGPYGALTVAEIADAAGLEERTAASSLLRLKASRWVTSEKPAVGDGRRTLYRLREPMLRHHVQYRSGDRSTLTLIVELLRSWFDRSERIARLLSAPLGSSGMVHVAASFRSEAGSPLGGGEVYNLDSLQSLARRWAAGEDSRTWGSDVGTALDDCLAQYRLTRNAETRSGEVTPRLADHIRRQADEARGRVSAGLWLISTMVQGESEPQRARERLAELSTRLPAGDPLQWQARMLDARLARQAGSLTEALTLARQLVSHAIATLGPDHPDTLWSRNNLANAYQDAGRTSDALTLFEATLADRERILGPDHPDTLWSRVGLADTYRRSGDIGRAMSLATELAADLSHRERLPRHQEWARWLLEACADAVIQGEGVADDGIAGLFARAVRGDAEATIRLPSELRELANRRPTDEPADEA